MKISSPIFSRRRKETSCRRLFVVFDIDPLGLDGMLQGKAIVIDPNQKHFALIAVPGVPVTFLFGPEDYFLRGFSGLRFDNVGADGSLRKGAPQSPDEAASYFQPSILIALSNCTLISLFGTRHVPPLPSRSGV